jgi:hypothetical protein
MAASVHVIFNISFSQQFTSHATDKQTNSVAFIPQANYTDCNLSAKFSANFG